MKRSLSFLALASLLLPAVLTADIEPLRFAPTRPAAEAKPADAAQPAATPAASAATTKASSSKAPKAHAKHRAKKKHKKSHSGR